MTSNTRADQCRAVFLDRDGTINIEKNYLYRPEDFEFTPGAPAAIARLNRANLKVVVVTNQAGIARGYFDLAAVHHLHAQMDKWLAAGGARVDAYYICPHHPDAGRGEFLIDCDCRKPNPGMLVRAARDLQIDLSLSYMVGDKLADLEAGQRAGCKSVLVRTGYGQEVERKIAADSFPVCDDLASAVDEILLSCEGESSLI